MGYKAELRAMQAAERRQEREAQKRLRDLERQAKEQAKLSAIEQARLEVETHESRLDLLLSVHKEQGPTWDWSAVAASLPPPPPREVLIPRVQSQAESSTPPTRPESGLDPNA